MLQRRIIRPIPATGIEFLPPGNCVVVDQTYDYIEEVEEGKPAPADAEYVAIKEKDGFVNVIKDLTKATKTKHTFAGWGHTPGESKPVKPVV